MSSVAIFMAEGCEEIEALTVVDLLRRANVKIDMLSITGEKAVTGSHGIKLETDGNLSGADLSGYDALVLPGGMPGTVNLKENTDVQKAISDFLAKEKLVAAICAAPARILGDGGFLEGFEATCYPGLEELLKGAKVRTDVPVVRDRNRITSRGLGTAIPFALEIISYLEGPEAAERQKVAIVFSPKDMV